MYIYKYQIDDYIKCPYLFAFNVLSKDSEDITSIRLMNTLNKVSQSKTSKNMNSQIKDKDIVWLKNSISKMAIQEMETGTKNSLYDYRNMLSNKFHKNIINSFEEESAQLLDRLNNLMSIFSVNVFMGYNVPVEIPIAKTNIIFRDLVDFILVDPFDDDNITIVEIADLSDPIMSKKYTEWIHYKMQYSFIAESLNKDIKLLVLDPIYSGNTIEFIYPKDKFKEYHDNANSFFPKILNPVLYKNLYECTNCELNSTCHGGKV